MRVTYVIYSHLNKAVKVGYASDLASRISTIQLATAEELSLLFTFQGGRDTELELHKLLTDYRIRGEWFIYNRDSLNILLKYQEKRLKEYTFGISSLDGGEIVDVVLAKAESLYKQHRSKKVTIPDIKQELLFDITTKDIKNILLNAGWTTLRQGSCKTLFFTQETT